MKIWIIAFILTTCGQELCRRGVAVKPLLPPPVMDKNEKLGMGLSASGALSHPGIFMNKRVWDKLSIPLGVGKNFAVGNCTERVKKMSPYPLLYRYLRFWMDSEVFRCTFPPWN